MLCKPFPKEVDQFRVHFIRMGPGYAVRSILHNHQARPLDQFGNAYPGGSDRQNPIRIALHDQGGDVDAGQILAEVLIPRGYASEAGRGRGPSCDVPAGLNGLFADKLAQQEVRVVEVLEKLREERITVGDYGFLDSLEDTAVHALRVVGRLQQEWRDCGDKDRSAHALRSVFPQVAGDFAANHRETNHREITQLELRHELVQVLSEGVVVVAGCWLAGLAEPSAVIGDDTVTCGQKHINLFLPGNAAQGISVDKNYGVA